MNKWKCLVIVLVLVYNNNTGLLSPLGRVHKEAGIIIWLQSCTPISCCWLIAAHLYKIELNFVVSPVVFIAWVIKIVNSCSKRMMSGPFVTPKRCLFYWPCHHWSSSVAPNIDANATLLIFCISELCWEADFQKADGMKWHWLMKHIIFFQPCHLL